MREVYSKRKKFYESSISTKKGRFCAASLVVPEEAEDVGIILCPFSNTAESLGTLLHYANEAIEGDRVFFFQQLEKPGDDGRFVYCWGFSPKFFEDIRQRFYNCGLFIFFRTEPIFFLPGKKLKEPFSQDLLIALYS